MHFSSIQQALVLASTLAIAHVHAYPYPQDNKSININAARSHAIVPNVDQFVSKRKADNLIDMSQTDDKKPDGSSNDASLTHVGTSRSSVDTHPRNDKVASQNANELYHNLRSVLMIARSFEAVVRKSKHTREDKETFEELEDLSWHLWYNNIPSTENIVIYRKLWHVHDQIDRCLQRIRHIFSSQPLVELTKDQNNDFIKLLDLLTRAQLLAGTASRTLSDQSENEKIMKESKALWTKLSDSKQQSQTAIFNQIKDVYQAILQETNYIRTLLGY